MKQKIIDIRSAYGQLILLIFLPIFLLAIVGATLVYVETMQANKHEQEILAKAILIRYKPIVKGQIPLIFDESDLKTATHSKLQLLNLLYSVKTQSELQRVAIVDEEGNVEASVGFKTKNSDNFTFKQQKRTNKKTDDDFTIATKTNIGTAYGISLGKLNINGQNKKLWLFVDMDNQPLKIAQYRIALALVVTGLLTILLLLLSLNIYSRRWIEPIYQIRLFLHGINIDSLNKPLKVNSDGELFQLQQDLVNTLNTINESFQELKEHAEQTEDDLRQAFDEMEMQNISIRNAHDQAVSTSEAKSAFLTNISHELRTPLNSIDGFINLLARDGKLSSEQNLYVQTIRKSSAHLLALVNDVLDFSKIEAGKLVLDSHEYDLYAAIYDVVDMLSPLASEKGLRLAVLFYNDVPLNIIGDALRMKQVLTNLVANAIKFTETGDVLVKVSLDDSRDNYLTIMVQDSGRGVAKEDQKQLFQNFTQGDPSITRQYGGTGLGLVISKQLTRLMGGNIGYYDNEENNIAATGSTFWFVMPTYVDVLEADNASSMPLPVLDKPKNMSLTNQQQESKLQILAWINHLASVQVLRASLQPLSVKITQTHSLVSTLERLKEDGNKWDWVIVDSDARTYTEDTEDNMTALLKQLRLYYQGKLAVYGYQFALDNELLARYKAYPLYEPLDKRQLYQTLDKRQGQANEVKIDFPKWQGYTVLAVDDHLPNLLVLDALLAEQGIEVITANSGFDAVEIISKQSSSDNTRKIDLIFMDIQMPRMSGHQASEQIRKINTHRRIPIIALTAHGMSDERDKLMSSGIDDYVGKPISQPQLLQILQKWLGKKHDDKEITRPVTDMYKEKGEVLQPNTALTAIRRPSGIKTKYDGDLPVIDWDDALKRSANKPDLAAKLIMMMIDSVAIEKKALQDAWSHSNYEQLAQVSHRILGASRYTGVPEIRDASQKLEEICLSVCNEDSSESDIFDYYQKLMTALTNLEDADLSPWPQLQYHRFNEDDMTWKMI